MESINKWGEMIKQIISKRKKTAKLKPVNSNEAIHTFELSETQKRMLANMNKLDDFLDAMIMDCGPQNISPREITQILLSKARDNTFMHTNCEKVDEPLNFMIDFLKFKSEEIFSMIKEIQAKEG